MSDAKASSPSHAPVVTEPAWLRYVLITTTLVFLGLFLVLPLVLIFSEALRQGVNVYFAALRDPDTISAILITLTVSIFVVPLNTVFGLAAGWAIGKFDFRGKNILITLIDLPFAVSPVISGLIFVLIFGLQGWLGHWLHDLDFHYPWIAFHGWWPVGFKWVHQIGVKIIFAIPGVILATTFVTFPFVAREVIALMQEQGQEEEQAALVLGASGWQTFWRVTIPNIKWALIYGVVLTNARAMGEFGAVSVVSGHIEGSMTMPLHIEYLYSTDYVAAFAVASLLAMLAVVTLVVKTLVEWRQASIERHAAEINA